MKKLWAWIKRDGLLHIETCALIAVVLGLLIPWWCAGLAAFLVGLCKEWWDVKHGVASWHDIICDFCGVIAGSVIVMLI